MDITRRLAVSRAFCRVNTQQRAKLTEWNFYKLHLRKVLPYAENFRKQTRANNSRARRLHDGLKLGKSWVEAEVKGKYAIFCLFRQTLTLLFCSNLRACCENPADMRCDAEERPWQEWRKWQPNKCMKEACYPQFPQRFLSRISTSKVVKR